MQAKSAVAAVAILAALGAIASTFLSLRQPPIQLGPYQALGAVAAEETLKLPGKPSQIVVIAQDVSKLEMPALESQIEAFTKTARKSSSVNVVIEPIAMDPMMMMSTGGRTPSDIFLKLLKKHPAPAAIVLFLGFPILGDSDLQGLPSRTIVVVAAYRPDYDPLLANGTIDLAIIPRPEPPAENAPQPTTLRQWFDQEYLILAPVSKPAQ